MNKQQEERENKWGVQHKWDDNEWWVVTGRNR